MTKHYLDVISNRNFRNLWLGQILSQISLNMLSFVLAIWVYMQTQSNAAVSFMLLSFAIPSVIFGFVAGSVVDYLDKKKVLFYCNLSRTILLLFYYFYSTSITALFALSVIISIITQFFIPAEGPTIPRLVKDKNLLSANSLFSVSFYLSSMIGFIVAGPMLKLFGHSNVFLVMSFLMLVSSYFVFKLPDLSEKTNKKENILNFTLIGKTLDEGLKFIKHHKRIRQSLILMTFSQALVTTLAVLAPGFADQVLKIHLTDASYMVMAPAAIGLVLGALWVGGYGIAFLKGTIILVGILFGGFTLVLLSLISFVSQVNLLNQGLQRIIFAVIMIFFLGVFNSFINVPANTILQQETDSHIRGRIYGALTSLTGGASLVPVIFSGILADIIGIGKALFTVGILVLIVAIYHLFERKKHRFLYLLK